MENSRNAHNTWESDDLVAARARVHHEPFVTGEAPPWAYIDGVLQQTGDQRWSYENSSAAPLCSGSHVIAFHVPARPSWATSAACAWYLWNPVNLPDLTANGISWV